LRYASKGEKEREREREREKNDEAKWKQIKTLNNIIFIHCIRHPVELREREREQEEVKEK
jgi:hypothetical protein